MTADMIVYMDSSALARRAAAGEDAGPLAELWDAAGRRVSSDLARAVLADTPEILDDLEIIVADRPTRTAADALARRHGLDEDASIHLATALRIDAPRVVFATWDPALAAAAAEHGFAVVPVHSNGFYGDDRLRRGRSVDAVASRGRR